MKKYIKSPLNYTGGKYKILDNILAILPNKINNFVDLFAGGLNVSINIDANIIYANDRITYIIDMYEYFKNNDIEQILCEINEVIEYYSLSKYNKEGYLALREEYNNNKNPIYLFVLTCFSFNHQIRFNNSLNYNVPFGKDRSSFNDSIKGNLIKFVTKLQESNFVFSSSDFLEFNFDYLTRDDVVYCDPPYLITNAAYNDGKRGFGNWTTSEEEQLLLLLDMLDSKGIKFVLSNVFYHKGMTNDILIEWSQKYKVIYVDNNYSNCNYNLKDRNSKTIEVLITNIK